MTPKTITPPLLLAMLAMPGAGALRCQVWPVRGRPVCWCYGAYGWTTAPMILCKLPGGAS